MESLLKYRMENLDWIDRFLEKLGVDAFLEFETRVYSALDKLKVMHYYDIGGLGHTGAAGTIYQILLLLYHRAP